MLILYYKTYADDFTTLNINFNQNQCCQITLRGYYSKATKLNQGLRQFQHKISQKNMEIFLHW